MTFNIRGGLGMDNRRSVPRIAAVIQAADPDLVGLQEVHCRLPASGMANQPAELACLTGLRAVFRPSLSLGFGAYGNLWLTRREPRRSGRRRLPGNREPRVMVWLELSLDGVPVRAAVTHLGLGVEERPRQAERLAAWVRENDGPTLLIGDLNTRPDSEELATLLATGLRHAVPPEPPTYPADAPRCRIDYLLVSRHWTVTRGEVLPTLASDHLPLVADLALEVSELGQLRAASR